MNALISAEVHCREASHRIMGHKEDRAVRGLGFIFMHLMILNDTDIYTDIPIGDGLQPDT